MADLAWIDVKEFFDPDLMGALPDLFAPETTVDDWRAVLDLVAMSDWAWRYEEDDAELPLPDAATALARSDETSVVLKVWPTESVQVNFWFLDPSQIDFDVDLRELQGQHGADILCAFLRTMGRELRKPVLMTNEGGDDAHPVLGYIPERDRVEVLAERFSADQ
ncbi:hypothetical protein ACFWQC_02090 [Nocardioides sp. NPDC058538]|uniref:hypothetical protein n=1 Tax=Nocardioides sp. NPDC058538 TaxID=3346542 RepID=UPI0036595FCB